MGKEFKGVYNLLSDTITVYQQGQGSQVPDDVQIKGLDSDGAQTLLGAYLDDFRDEIELVRGASHEFNQQDYLDGKLTPVFFGTARRITGVLINLISNGEKMHLMKKQTICGMH